MGIEIYVVATSNAKALTVVRRYAKRKDINMNDCGISIHCNGVSMLQCGTVIINK
jgi:hypothetical protein